MLLVFKFNNIIFNGKNDGITLIKNIRNHEKFKNIPAIAVTSLDSPEDRQNGLNDGFDGYQVKIDKEELI